MKIFFDPNDIQAVAAAAIAQEMLGETADYIACPAGKTHDASGPAYYFGVTPPQEGKFLSGSHLFHSHPLVGKDYAERIRTVAKPVYLKEAWLTLRPGTLPNRRWKRVIQFLEEGPILDGTDETTHLERGYLVLADDENRNIDSFRQSSDNARDALGAKIAPKKKAYLIERLKAAELVQIGNAFSALVVRHEVHCVSELTAYLGFIGQDVEARKGAIAYGTSQVDTDGVETFDLHTFTDQRFPDTHAVREQHQFVPHDPQFDTPAPAKKPEKPETSKQAQKPAAKPENEGQA